jgi:translation initiation factor eIF-2B subunit alpha
LISFVAYCDIHLIQGQSIAVNAACDLFSGSVTEVAQDVTDFAKFKAQLTERGTQLSSVASKCCDKISQYGSAVIQDHKVVLVHGRSRVVSAVLKHAAKQGKHFSVILTECRPCGSGYSAAQELLDAGIPCTMVLDSAVGYIMERVDLVLVGAEGVVQSGGIVNVIGTYQIAMMAKALNRPFYVAAETFKFFRLFPLRQSDVPNFGDRAQPQPIIAGTESPAGLQVGEPQFFERD